jgi:hypothetical protein
MKTKAPKELSPETVAEFAEVAERFCAAVDRIEELSEIEFLREMDVLLPLAYSKAREFPDLGLGGGEEQSDVWYDGRDNRSKEVRSRIERKLRDHTWFRHVHDPMDPKDQEVHVVSLADELAGVVVGLEAGLSVYRKYPDNLDRIVRAWTTGLDVLWGDNAVDAIPAMSRLVRNHYDEDDEVFDI